LEHNEKKLKLVFDLLILLYFFYKYNKTPVKKNQVSGQLFDKYSQIRNEL